MQCKEEKKACEKFRSIFLLSFNNNDLSNINLNLLPYEVTKQVFIIIIISVDIVHKVNVKGSFKGFLQWMKI
jgi:hypothetical protein